MSRSSVFLSFLLALLAGTPSSQAGEPTLWERPALIGASAASGFTMLELFGGPRTKMLGLQTNLTLLIKAPHGPIADHSEPKFFQDPHAHAKKKTKQALAGKPTVVFAPDFLFWFVYGRMENEATRLNVLENGLNYLERFTCPVVIGNIPNAISATGLMLRKDQVPTATTIALANRRIKAWAATRESKVAVVELNRFMAQSLASQEVRLRHRVFPPKTTGQLFQLDKLHPNQAGAQVFAFALLEALQDKVPFPDGDVDWHKPLPERLAPSPKPAPVPAK